ncbi:hypothetical protein [Vibrio rarus]|uniref:hypothetical protein n=1 Tax=Vibrio rarus TaxID=413403 RepID=UPI0021C329D0|nr:hypothetical protein [Vibrio rarus]
MCKQSGFSRYQKRVIKFLSDYLGVNIPFSYERTQTNHLKVLIEGVPKPMYTGATPSDRKSFNNFVADVKREIKALNNSETSTTSAKNVKTVIAHTDKYDRVIKSSVKGLRGRIDTLKTREEEQVLDSRSIECVNTFRSDTVKQAVSMAIQARKQVNYLKAKDIKEVEDKARTHLDFMMPTMACYANLLNNKTKYALGKEPHLVAVNDDRVAEDNTHKSREITESEVAIPQINSQLLSVPANDLVKMSSTERIKQLRNLSKAEALSLIEDIKQAIALNREEDIQSVVSIILEKELPIEAIISRIEAA